MIRSPWSASSDLKVSNAALSYSQEIKMSRSERKTFIVTTFLLEWKQLMQSEEAGLGLYRVKPST